MVLVPGLGFFSFVLPFVFCFFLLPPYTHQLPGLGEEGFVFCNDPIFLLVSFLGLVTRRPRGGGMGFLSNR